MLATRGRWPFWAVVVVLVVGLATTGVLTWLSVSSYSHNENRLLKLRAGDVATLLTSALPSIQTPLASAAALADATHGNREKFMRLVAPYVGHGKGQPFASVSLWRVSDPQRGPVAVVGSRPRLVSTGRAPIFFVKASATSTLSLIGMLRGSAPRLGYAFTGSGRGPFAYGESALSPSRYAPAQQNGAFSDLNFALYLGRTSSPGRLLIASVRHLPLTGRHTTVKVPFGDTYFTVTVAARGPLSGTLPQRIPWLIAIAGVLLTLAASGLTAGLIVRRRRVERLADQLERTAEENRRLYAEQRSIAQTLQHALLPSALPQLPGLEVGARYQAGVEGVEIGGDWYDLIALKDERLLLVVGDVSGRGLKAATTMASLRFAIHAYSAQGDGPAAFLPKLSSLLSVSTDRQLATVLCTEVDVARRRVSFTNAGHLPPLMISDGGGHYVESDIGLPIGIDREVVYSPTTVSVSAGTTLLVFTDGLVERRGESIDAGLERLRSHVVGDHLPLDDLLGRILHDVQDDASDDTAIAAIRWTS